MRPAVRARLDAAASVRKPVEAGPLYDALCRDAGSDAAEVLLVAARRHPAASWLLDLAQRYEAVPGQAQLEAAVDHASFQVVAWACAMRGFLDALVDGGSLGRPETAAALLAHGYRDEAVESAARALGVNPTCAVVGWLAAVDGPGAEDVIARLVPRVRSRDAALGLDAQLSPFPSTRRLLHTALAGLV